MSDEQPESGLTDERAIEREFEAFKEKMTNQEGNRDAPLTDLGGNTYPEEANKVLEHLAGVKEGDKLKPWEQAEVDAKKPKAKKEEGNVMPQEAFLAEKKKWKERLEVEQQKATELQNRFNYLQDSMAAQRGQPQPPPQADSDNGNPFAKIYTPITGEDLTQEQVAAQLQQQNMQAQQLVLSEVQRFNETEVAGVRNAMLRQGMETMLDRFFAATGIAPQSKEGKFAAKGIISYAAALPEHLKPNAPEMWMAEYSDIVKEKAESEHKKATEKKTEVTDRNIAATPPGKSAGAIPNELFNKDVPVEDRAEQFLRWRAGGGKVD